MAITRQMCFVYVCPPTHALMELTTLPKRRYKYIRFVNSARQVCSKKNFELKLLCNIIEIRPNTCTTLTQDFFLGNHQPEDNIFENLVTKRLLTTFHLTPILLVTHDKIFKILIVAMAVDHGTHSEQKRNIQCIFKFTFL